MASLGDHHSRRPAAASAAGVFALGTNVGIRHVAGGEGGDFEAMQRRVRRLFVNRDNLRRALTRLVNVTFVVRDEAMCGRGTACASDSKKLGSWSSNFMTEYHVRYGGAGVMIYWHVERKTNGRRRGRLALGSPRLAVT